MAREQPDRDFTEREQELLALQEQYRTTAAPPHVCMDHAEYVEFDGPLGQAYYCRVCGTLLQVG